MIQQAQQILCSTCRTKNNESEVWQLEKMLRILKNGYEPDRMARHIEWYASPHCRYGICCPMIEERRAKINRLSKEVEEYMESVIKSHDTKTCKEILELCRGYFPSAYHYFERRIME